MQCLTRENEIITISKVRNLIKLEVRTTLHPSFLLAPVEGWGSFEPLVLLEHQVKFPGAPLSSRPKKLCAPLNIGIFLYKILLDS